MIFRHNAFAHLTDYSVNITFICIGKQKYSCDSLYCQTCFIAVVWNQTLNISELCLYLETMGSHRYLQLQSNMFDFPFFILINPFSRIVRSLAPIILSIFTHLLCSFSRLQQFPPEPTAIGKFPRTTSPLLVTVGSTREIVFFFFLE